MFRVLHALRLPIDLRSVRVAARRIIETPTMNWGRIAYILAVLAVFCVLAVFFFHAIQGPYSAVHGPVTALLSARAAAGLRTAIVFAGSAMAQLWVGLCLLPISWRKSVLLTAPRFSSCVDSNSILRC